MVQPRQVLLRRGSWRPLYRHRSTRRPPVPRSPAEAGAGAG